MLSNYQILLMRTSYCSVKSYCMTYYRPKGLQTLWKFTLQQDLKSPRITTLNKLILQATDGTYPERAVSPPAALAQHSSLQLLNPMPQKVSWLPQLSRLT